MRGVRVHPQLGALRLQVVVWTAQPVGFEGGAHAGDEAGTALEADC